MSFAGIPACRIRQIGMSMRCWWSLRLSLRHGRQQRTLLSIQILLLTYGRILYGIDDIIHITVHLLLIEFQLIPGQLTAVESCEVGMRWRWWWRRLTWQTRRWRWQELTRFNHRQQHAGRGGALVVQPIRNYRYANGRRSGMTMMMPMPMSMSMTMMMMVLLVMLLVMQ